MSRSRTAPRRLATVLAATGLALTVSLAGQPAQAATTTTDPAQAAAGWLADQMVDGERFEAVVGDDIFPDQGLTLDAVLAFAAAGAASDHAAAAVAWLATPEILDGYLGYEYGDRFAGAHAKLAFAADVYGLDAASFGGVDVLAELRDLQDGDGRFRDESSFGDFSNVFSQSFAILALAGTADGVPAEVSAFLAAEQCADGGFPLDFGTDPCVSGVDTTAMAVQALLAADAGQPAAAGLAWLAEHQEPDGGFVDLPGSPSLPVNANSTGLAAQALWAGGLDEAAEAATALLQSLQVGCDGAAAEQGAVTFDGTGVDDRAARATAQAVLGLAGVGLAELDGTTAQAEAPRLDCETEPSPSPTAPPPAGQGGEQLPVTGSSALALTGVGLLLVGAGGFAVWTVRRRTGPLPTG